MNRAFAALSVMAVLVASAVFVGSASAGVTKITTQSTTTSIIVTGHETNTEFCLPVNVRVSNDELGYDQTKRPTIGPAGNFKVTFSGLQPGTSYRVEVWDRCSEGDIFDAFVSTLDAPPEPVVAPAEEPIVIPQGPDRYIFCAVAGNTDVNGKPLAPGTSLNLEADQVTGDDHYKGATIGFFVAGVGATCQLTPQQAALASASTKKVNHVGGTGDYNEPEVYTFIG